NPVLVSLTQQPHAHDLHLEHDRATSPVSTTLLPPPRTNTGWRPHSWISQKLANIVLATDTHQCFSTRSNAKGVAMLRGTFSLD
ncbi:hypothetical protein J4714_13945, partial [Staphylococcus epidermidis]|nr:hypothetical protein [Staphylococcus epidermidis]